MLETSCAAAALTSPAAIGLEPFGFDLQTIGCPREALQPEVEGGCAFVVGDAGRQGLFESLLRDLRVVESIAGVRVECRESRRQRQVCGDAPVGRGGTKEVLQVDGGLQVVRRDPTFGGFGREVRGHPQPVG